MNAIFKFLSDLLVSETGQCHDVALAMIDLAQPVVEMGSQGFWV